MTLKTPNAQNPAGRRRNAHGSPRSAQGDEPTAEQAGVLRAVDAAANRAAEGLRVVEDYVRFVLDDRHLTEVCKHLRHRLADVLSGVAAADRHTMRDTQGDVGTTIGTSAEGSRPDAWSVCSASFHRTEQALRSLEEYGKVLDPELAARIEALRYETYTLERAACVTRTSVERLATTRLYVLVDGRETAETFSSLVGSLVAAGVQAIQLRDKSLSDRDLLERARLLREQTRETSTLAIVNDRPDVARLSDADGVHVGQEELGVSDVRRVVGPRALVGVSTHSIEQARQAVLDGANYIGVGPTFPSSTKSFDEFPGLDLLRAVAAEIRLPTFAIGGITEQNTAQVLATGIDRIAVGAAVTGDEDPSGIAAHLLHLLTD